MSDAMLDIKVTPAEAARLEEAGFQIVDELPASNMSEVLRKEIVRICQEGDTKTHKFSVSTISHLERFIPAAREILIAEKISSNDLEGLLRGRRRKHLGGQILGGALIGNGGMGAENFGGQAIRQLIDAAGKMNETPAKLVEALASAKEHGLDDVVKVLEAKLGVVSKPHLIEASPTPAPEGEAK